jgi:hypothetical protein
MSFKIGRAELVVIVAATRWDGATTKTFGRPRLFKLPGRKQLEDPHDQPKSRERR